jgi:hypothetical protein
MDDHPDAARYEIHVRGILSERLLGAFPELRARTRNGVTVLAGALPDQAALHGVLTRTEALGLELLEVRRRRTQHPPAGEPAELDEAEMAAASPSRPAGGRTTEPGDGSTSGPVP